MKKDGRYSVPSNEDYEPRSDNTVLKNKLNITSKQQMDTLEATALKKTTREFLSSFSFDHTFTANDLLTIHKHWLGDIYYFAGQYRSVNMAKDGFQFANANFILRLMQQFETGYLKKFTPCSGTIEEIAAALAVVHVEFILIHPFRDGNGRLGRTLATLMATQAGLPMIDFSYIAKNATNTAQTVGHNAYIKAIHAGLDCDYKPMESLFCKMINC